MQSRDKNQNYRRFLRAAARRLLAALLIGCGVSNLAVAAESRSFSMGFTPWPWALDNAAVQETYNFINNNSDIISHHIEEGVPWPEALANKPYHPNMMEAWEGRKNWTSGKLKVFLSISPINQLRDGMADYRGADYQMPIPAPFKGKRFNDPDVKKAYLRYARKAVDFFQPDYLAIAIEVNELLDNNPGAWDDFVELYRNTYKKLKKDHPELPIFFTASVHNIVNPERGDPAHTWKKIEALWKHADIAAISFYPFLQRPLDLAKATAALDEVKRRTNKPIAIAESGYPGKQVAVKALKDLPATPDVQKNIYYAMLSQALQDQYEFFIVWCYRDYDKLWDDMKGQIPEWGALWRDVGIVDGGGKARPSKDIWDTFRSLKLQQ